MYLLLLILPILLLLLLVNYFRKKKKIQKVNSLSTEEKNALLDEIIEPFGYKYLPAQDLFSTRIDAPQREFGYSALYDKGAAHINLIFDCLPVYFTYRGRTWLLEFWKGQYGINTGAEMGIYYTNRILEDSEIKNTFFRAAEDVDMLKMSLSLYRDDTCIATLSEKHWWLTAFRMGYFSQPSDLRLRASVTFPTGEMANAFVEGLKNAGYAPADICRCCSNVGCGNVGCGGAGRSSIGYNTVSFTFDHSPRIYGIFRRMRVRLAQWSNKLLCKIYLFVTRPFQLSVDRLLYLYFYLPFAFRRTLRVSKKQRRNWRTARRRDAKCCALASLRAEEAQKSARTQRETHRNF